MRMHRRTALLGAAVLLNLAVAMPASAALATYTYFGNTFTDNPAGAGRPDTPFTTQGSISGTFVVDCTGIGSGDCASLPFQDYTARVTSFSFGVSDAVTSPGVSNANVVAALPGNPRFSFSTTSTRDMLVWSLQMSGASCSTGVIFCALQVTGRSVGQSLPPADTATAVFLNLAQGSAIAFSPGTFTVSAVPLPLPLALLLPCLVALLPTVRRRAGKGS